MIRGDGRQGGGSEPMDIIGGWLTYVVLFAVICIIAYANSVVFVSIWRIMRLVELTIYHALTNSLSWITPALSTSYFMEGASKLYFLPASRINLEYIIAFESDFNSRLRFFYAGIVGLIGFRMITNYRRVTKHFNVQTMMESYRHQNEAIESLAVDNPLKGSRIFNFDNRGDYHNRHAQALSPQMILEACPPPLATSAELKEHKKAVRQKNPSPSRPIARFDHKNKTYEFSRSDCRIMLERQLTKTPTLKPFYSNEEQAPRLFDEDGNVVPLIKSIQRLKKKKRSIVTGGFALNGLINNGRAYHGSFADAKYLFNGIEREVFVMLCSRYRNTRIPLEQVVLKLLTRHAYTRTYLVSLLNIVRVNELVASTEFYMLARRDRGLYFALYSASEEKPFFEALGVMCHYMYELEMSQGIVAPQISNAIDSFDKNAKRLSAWEEPTKDLLAEMTHNLNHDDDIADARLFTDSSEQFLDSLLNEEV